MRPSVYAVLVALSVCALPVGAGAQARTGEAIYRDACLTCHGEDGTGGPPERLGSVDPPDFSDCAFATAEPDPDWSNRPV